MFMYVELYDVKNWVCFKGYEIMVWFRWGN